MLVTGNTCLRGIKKEPAKLTCSCREKQLVIRNFAINIACSDIKNHVMVNTEKRGQWDVRLSQIYSTGKATLCLRKRSKGNPQQRTKPNAQMECCLQHVEGRLSKCSSSVSGLNEKALKHLQPSYQYWEEIKIILSIKSMGQASIGDNES